MNGWSIIAGAVGVLPSMLLLGANGDLSETLATLRVLMLAWLQRAASAPR